MAWPSRVAVFWRAVHEQCDCSACRLITNVGVLQWFAISTEIMVRPRQYFPVVPLPIDPVASTMCFGKTCTDATKWQDIMNMANWRAEAGVYYYQWGCSHRTATISFTFAEAFEEVPAVRTYMNHFDECGFNNFDYWIVVEIPISQLYSDFI